MALNLVAFAGLAATPSRASSPWAGSVVYDHGGTAMTFGPFHGSPMWNNPEALVGKVNTLDRDDTNWSNPTFRELHMCWAPWYMGSNDAALANQPYNAAVATNNGIGLTQGSQIVMAFDEPII